MGVFRAMDTFQPTSVQLGGDFEENFKQQISSVIDILRARKMRVNVSETSHLALQSVGGSQSGSMASPVVTHTSSPGNHKYGDSSDDHSAPAAHHLSRRYSRPQAETGAETTDVSGEILNRFSQTVTMSSSVLLRRGSGHRNLYEKNSMSSQQGGSTVTDAEKSSLPQTQSALPRGQSTPNLQALDRVASAASSSSGGLISRYLRRHGSMETVLPATAVGEQTNSALVPATSGSSDVTSSSTSSALSQYSGRSVRETPLLEDPAAPTVSTGSPSRFSLLSRTRQFGAWLSKATDGEKVEVSHKDLNTIVPNSF